MVFSRFPYPPPSLSLLLSVCNIQGEKKERCEDLNDGEWILKTYLMFTDSLYSREFIHLKRFDDVEVSLKTKQTIVC